MPTDEEHDPFPQTVRVTYRVLIYADDLLCGRFTLRTNWARIAQQFQLDGWEELQPRYNIAPESPVACIRRNAEVNRASQDVPQCIEPAPAKTQGTLFE